MTSSTHLPFGLNFLVALKTCITWEMFTESRRHFLTRILNDGNIRNQVWSLTQFYSVDISQSRIGVKKCVFNKRTIKICVSSCWRCLRTSTPSPALPTVTLHLYSSGSNPWGEVRALEGCSVSSKKPFKGPRRRQGSGWEERKIIVFPQTTVMDFLPIWHS